MDGLSRAQYSGFSLEDHEFARANAVDTVRTRPDHRRQRRSVKGRRIDGMFGEHGHEAKDQRELPVTLGKVEANAVRADLRHSRKLAGRVRVARVSLVAQQFDGEDDVLRRDGWPSEKRASGSSVNSTKLRASSVSTVFARSG